MINPYKEYREAVVEAREQLSNEAECIIIIFRGRDIGYTEGPGEECITRKWDVAGRGAWIGMLSNKLYLRAVHHRRTIVSNLRKHRNTIKLP